jgi:hypothetical protein
MRTETFQIHLTVDATDRVSREEIAHELRPQLEAMQEPEPWRSSDGDAWYVNRRSYVEIHDMPTLAAGEVHVTFDPSDAVSVIRALREVIGPETLRVVAHAELTR